MSHKIFLLTLIFATVLTGSVLAQQYTEVPIITEGSIVYQISVEVYDDYLRTQPCDSISWGSVMQGGSSRRNVFIYNPNAYPITLYLRTDNYSPPESIDYLSVSWDREGVTVPPYDTWIGRLDLHVCENITGIDSFSIGLSIGGIES